MQGVVHHNSFICSSKRSKETNKTKSIKMKFFILTLALVAGVMADVSELSSGYDYHAPAPSAPVNTYIPPAASVPVPEYHAPAPSAPVNTYIPPAASAPAPVYHAPAPAPVYHAPAATAPVNTYIPPAASAPAPVYHAPAPAYSESYSTAASVPSNSYLAPAASAPSNSYLAPAASAPVASASFGDDGYRYKTVRRRVIRKRF
ncbi:uncharacterized protein LOC131804520 [Musca domestica]|uniref:Uncharacterized protein LOC131803190 n=1 Tax=Musca domestica TaxID=7370 RepID=A0ABM3V397_MUSDO|nr:uncharacterized protein LOC131803190 [Musca domestica]XP_058983480.1 uncharacterized protein LOC131804520 [Musca domestica]